MKAILFALFIVLLMAGCGQETQRTPAESEPRSDSNRKFVEPPPEPNRTSAETTDAKVPEASTIDLDDPEPLKKIVPEAIDDAELEDRQKELMELYDPDKQRPYTGEVKELHFNGRVKDLIQYKNGKKHGRSSRWCENGKREEEKQYKNGKLHGRSTRWYENGQKASENNYKDAKPHGLWALWSENGLRRTQKHYQDEKLHGRATRWYENGQKMEEKHYQKDKLHGRATRWYENGQKEKEVNYKKGKLMSAVAWTPNGEECPVTNVKEGNGIILIYKEDGTEDERITYKDGELVRE